MTHFLYLLGFALLVSVAFAVFFDGTMKERVIYGVKSFLQYVVVSLVLAWILYFIPW
ncbi:MAG TPA: hypothetical protein PKA82_14855 [Pyrinomonadaceae bacterium]|nr:hypothetical protein [Pyrinomonadaceae bacterium]